MFTRQMEEQHITFEHWSTSPTQEVQPGKEIRMDVCFSPPTTGRYAELGVQVIVEITGPTDTKVEIISSQLFATNIQLAGGGRYVYPYTFTVPDRTFYYGHKVTIRPRLRAFAGRNITEVKDVIYATANLSVRHRQPRRWRLDTRAVDPPKYSLGCFIWVPTTIALFLVFLMVVSRDWTLPLYAFPAVAVAYLLSSRVRKIRHLGPISASVRPEGDGAFLAELDFSKLNAKGVRAEVYYAALELVTERGVGEHGPYVREHRHLRHPSPPVSFEITGSSTKKLLFEKRDPEPVYTIDLPDISVSPALVVDLRFGGDPVRYVWWLRSK